MKKFADKAEETIWKKFGELSLFVKIQIEILLVLVLIILGVFLFHRIEGWRYLDSLYFIITTLSSVGYGDFTPKTDTGKIVAMFYICLGAPLFIYTGAIIIAGKIKKSHETMEQVKKKKKE